MSRYLFMAGSLVALATSAALADTAMPTAAQIIERNVAARGGLNAWRAVNTLTLSGQMEAGGKKNTELPFTMRMKRPHKSRLEIRFQNQTALQVYDGKQGWKVRPFLGRDDAEPFSPAETKAAAAWEELDGPLVDYARKGTNVVLQGTESVEGQQAYKLELTMKDGERRHLWVDAKSFLELKIEGEPRKLDGKVRQVAIFYRDYKAEHGLTVPHVFETVVDGVKQPHEMRIDRVTINEKLDDAIFEKPVLAGNAKPSG
jgi:outer membrane lipoprotein-sorting protein